MRKSLTFSLILLQLVVAKVTAQNLYQRTYTPFLNNIEQETLTTDELIVAGTHTLNFSAIGVVKFNSCGTVIWSKRFSTDTNNLHLIDFKIDQNQNAILAGNYIYSNGDRNAFLMSISPNGALNYFKVFNTGTGDIVYSMDINPQNEILLYFKTNIGQAGPQSNNTLAKLDANGQVLWIKDYGFTWVWGQMCSNSDGGALISDIQNIVKINSSGMVSWTKLFENNFYSQDHFEIPGGYIFFRYKTSALNQAYACMIDYSGNIKWNSQLLQFFNPSKGILRQNGNLLFVGDFYLQGSTNNPTFIEIDTSNGTILKTIIQSETMPLAYLQDLSELGDQSVVFAGFEQLSTIGSTIVGRINDTLARIGCKDTLINLNSPRDSGTTQAATAWTAQAVNIPTIEPQLTTTTLTVSQTQLLCEYTQALSLNLGEDTTLCPRNSINLSASSNFDGYKWSNGQGTSSILVDQAGTYWLKAWVACDTITDTISINYHQLPKLELGKDTIVCPGVNITFSTNNGETAYWSNGDTASSINVDQAGKYWADIPTVCGYISDTIMLMHHPELKEPKLGNDTNICLNTQLQLNVDPNATSVLWSTGETSHQIQTDTAGTYFVTITNACDTISDTLKINFHPKPKLVPIVSKDSAKVLDSIHFQLLSSKNFLSIQWDYGDGQQSSQTNSIHQYKASGWMYPEVSIIDSLGCQFDSSLRIYIQALDFHIPNVFTPNGDGINDYFEVYGDGIELMQIKVYNRWGNLISESNNGAWDGRTYGGKAAKDGIYYYQILLKQSGNKARKVEGNVSLIRESKNSMLE
jgi:gliding motility-associated-like protein